MKHLLHFCCILMLCLLALPVMAQEDGNDYLTNSGDWNGLQDFQILVRAQGAELVVHERVDYNKLNLDEPWIVVYPEQTLKRGSFAQFVIAGGRILLADDFGKSESLLKRLDLTRATPPHGALPHQEFMQQNPALPIFRPTGVHPLLDNVNVVVANHPAVLFNVGGPVVPYGKDGGLFYDMNLGKGKVLALADASMLINHMVLLADNDKLLRNSIKYICKGEPKGCRVHLVVGKFEQTGSYGSDDETNLLGLSRDLVQSVSSFNSTISELMQNTPTDKLFFYLNFFLIAGLASFLYTIFPIRKTRPYSAYLSDSRDQVAKPQSEYDWNLSRFEQGGPGTNYLLPASILKELFEALFLKDLGIPIKEGKETRLDVPGLTQKFAEKHLKQMNERDANTWRKEITQVLAQFSQLPTRHRVFLDSDKQISEKELLKLHERAMDILMLMGLKDDYERRTRSYI